MCKIILIETSNFVDFPIGGQHSFARQMMKAFGNRLSLVGLVTDSTPVGKWVKINIDGTEYDFFGFAKIENTAIKPFIPSRLKEYWCIKNFRGPILEKGVSNVLIRSHHLLAAVLDWGFDNICFFFPGVENPLSISRYAWAKPLAKAFDLWFLPKLVHADVILAAADKNAIDQLITRSRGKLNNEMITHFPTRVDTAIFKKCDKVEMRQRLSLPLDKTIVVTTGRINWIKGWRLLLDAFIIFKNIENNALLVFVGDGEDRMPLENELNKRNLTDSVIITGRKSQSVVGEYLGAADIFTMGSIKEGWPTSLVEAMASYLPLVCTNVSGADSIIRDGINGYVVPKRDPELFAKYMLKSLDIDLTKLVIYVNKEIDKYAVKYLARDLLSVWDLL